MIIRNEISLCTNQVLYNLTSSMLSGLLVPLFVIVLFLEEKPLRQQRDPDNRTQVNM